MDFKLLDKDINKSSQVDVVLSGHLENLGDIEEERTFVNILKALTLVEQVDSFVNDVDTLTITNLFLVEHLGVMDQVCLVNVGVSIFVLRCVFTTFDYATSTLIHSNKL